MVVWSDYNQGFVFGDTYIGTVNRVGVHTWNVAGKPPPDDLDLEDWIDVSDPADIYVFGFVLKLCQFQCFHHHIIWSPTLIVKQKWRATYIRADICVMIPKYVHFFLAVENIRMMHSNPLESLWPLINWCRFQEIVPLNASNVLSVEDEGPAMKWEANIREFLNTRIGPKRETKLARTRSLPSSSTHDHVDIIPVDVPEVSNVKKLLGSCLGEEVLMSSTFRAAELNLLNQLGVNYKKELFKELRELPSTNEAAPVMPPDDYSWPFARIAPMITAMVDETVPQAAHPKFVDSLSFLDDMEPYQHVHQQYSRVASKQMVGLFITVWIRSDLWRHVHNVQVSAVGCGLMNYLGNKVSFNFLRDVMPCGHSVDRPMYLISWGTTA